MGYELMEAAKGLQAFSGEMPVPTLLFHGTADKITSHPASKAFAEQVSGPLSFTEFEGFYHETHNEPGKVQVFERIGAWLKALNN